MEGIIEGLTNFKDWGPAWLIALAAVLGLIWLIRWQANTLASLIGVLMDVVKGNTVSQEKVAQALTALDHRIESLEQEWRARG